MLGDSFLTGMQKNIWELKSRKMLSNVNHSYIIADVTPLYAQKQNQLIHFPRSFCKFLGLKDKNPKSNPEHPLKLPVHYAVALLIFSVIIASLFPLLILRVNMPTPITIFGRFLFTFLCFLPLAAKEIFFSSDRPTKFDFRLMLKSQNVRMVLTHSLYFCSWCYFFIKSLDYSKIGWVCVLSS
jgi:hypothetical protein